MLRQRKEIGLFDVSTASGSCNGAENLGADSGEKNIVILVDITRPGSLPRAVNELKASQTYVRRNDIKSIMIAGTNKLMRLMLLLTFNLCRPSLRFFDNLEQAQVVARRSFDTDHVESAMRQS